MMKKELFIILTLLICSIYTYNHKPRNLQKILKGLNTKTRFAEVSEKSHNRALEHARIDTKQETEGYKALVEKIHTYSEELTKQRDDPEKRKIVSGQLSNFYPKVQRDLAAKMVEEKRKEGKLTKYIDASYRFCIFPYSEINAMTFCEQNFQKISPQRATRCKHYMCTNCCGHIQLILKYITSQSIVSDVLGLADDAGFNKIKNTVSKQVIDNCRLDCKKEYHVAEPVILPAIERNPDLGHSKELPAQNCQDVLHNGNKRAKDDKYHIQLTENDPFMVYCDQTTDGGGWTLFFAYSHHPYEEYEVNGSELPLEPEIGRSHSNLRDTGFQEGKDVSELKFWCFTEHKHKGKQQFMHFKSQNPDLLKVAMNGDQLHMKVKSWKSEASPLEALSEKFEDETIFFQSRANMNCEAVGDSETGGFWNKPFSGQQGSWCVKGGAKAGGLWECGDNLDVDTGARYETLHTIFFRGPVPEPRAFDGYQDAVHESRSN